MFLYPEFWLVNLRSVKIRIWTMVCFFPYPDRCHGCFLGTWNFRFFASKNTLTNNWFFLKKKKEKDNAAFSSMKSNEAITNKLDDDEQYSTPEFHYPEDETKEKANFRWEEPRGKRRQSRRDRGISNWLKGKNCWQVNETKLKYHVDVLWWTEVKMMTKNYSTLNSLNYFRINHGFFKMVLKSWADFFLNKFYLCISTRRFSKTSNKENLKENA